MKIPGHESASERQKLSRLESLAAKGTAGSDDLLELALFYMEPFHQEEKAIETLELCLGKDPDGWTARVWLAYLYLHYGLDETSLKAAQMTLTPLTDMPGAPGAAAGMLLSQIGRELGELDPAGEAELLERSVALEPSWANNRYLLAHCYGLLGRVGAALAQLDAAASSVTSPQTPSSKAELEFESAITARTAHGIRGQIESMRRKIESW